MKIFPCFLNTVALLLGISDFFIFRRMKDIQHPKLSHLPEVLSIDEFRGNAGGQKFQDILTDAKNHRLLTYFQPVRKRIQKELYLSKRKYFKRSRKET